MYKSLKIKNNSLKDRYDACFQIVNQLNKGKLFKNYNVLDYGCGEGFFIKKISSLFKNSIGYEPLLKKEKKVDNIFFVNSFKNIKNFKYKIITSTAVFEHLHNPGYILSELNKLIEDNGFFLIAIPNPVNLRDVGSVLLRPNLKKSLLKRSKNILNNYAKESHHIHSWDHNHIVNLFSSCGFQLLDYYAAEGCPLPIFFLKNYLPFPNKVNLIKPLNRLSYTNIFLFQKKKEIDITIYD